MDSSAFGLFRLREGEGRRKVVEPVGGSCWWSFVPRFLFDAEKSLRSEDGCTPPYRRGFALCEDLRVFSVSV